MIDWTKWHKDLMKAKKNFDAHKPKKRGRKYQAPKVYEPNEKQIQNTILQWLELIMRKESCIFWQQDTTGVYDPVRKVFRTNPRRMKGIADIMGVYRGIPIAIEVKRKGGKQSPEQKEFERKFAAAGGQYLLAFDLAPVMELIQKIGG